MILDLGDERNSAVGELTEVRGAGADEVGTGRAGDFRRALNGPAEAERCTVHQIFGLSRIKRQLSVGRSSAISKHCCQCQES